MTTKFNDVYINNYNKPHLWRMIYLSFGQLFTDSRASLNQLLKIDYFEWLVKVNVMDLLFSSQTLLNQSYI